MDAKPRESQLGVCKYIFFNKKSRFTLLKHREEGFTLEKKILFNGKNVLQGRT